MMENIFDIINKKIPKTPESTEQTLQPATLPGHSKPEPLKEIVARWQSHETPEDTKTLLTRLKPTMSSAINSYAPGMEKEMSIKAATLTLDALRKYDPSVGTDPSTFVFHNLKRLHRLNSQHSNILPIPENVALETKRLTEVSNDFADEHGREPSMEELANLTGFNTRKIDKLLNTNRVVNDTSMISEDSQQSTVSDKDLTDLDYFEYVYSSVGPIDQKIMEWTSGLHGKQSLSNNQIAAKLHISPAAVSQRKSRLQELMSDVRGLL